MSRLKASALPAVGLAAVALALFPGALLGRTVSKGDLQMMFLGQNDALLHCLARGSWPVWDPFLGFGQPLLANPGNQVLYPPTWTNLLFGPETCLTLYVLGHLLWAGLGTYALGRRELGLSRWAAWLAGAAWMSSGPLLSHVQRWQHFASIAWLPWLVLAAAAGVRAPGRGRAVVLAAGLALQWLSGSVEVAAASLLVAAVWSALAAARSGPRPAPRFLAAWLPAGLLAVGLTAAQWLPAIALLRSSARGEAVRVQQMWWSVHPLRWLELVTPLRMDEIPLTDTARQRLLGEAGSTIVPSLYAGTVAAALAAFALFAPARRRAAVVLALAAAVAGVLAMGPHGYVLPWLAARVPLLGVMRFPGKLTLVVSFAWALLGGLGLDAWRAARERDGSRALVAWLVAAALPPAAFAAAVLARPGLLAGRLVPAPPPGARVVDVLSVEAWACGAAVLAAALAVALVLASARGGGAGRGGWIVAALALVAAVDPLLPNRRVNPMVPRALVGAAPETAQVLRRLGAARIHVIEAERPDGPDGPWRWDIDPRVPLDTPEALALGMNLSLYGRSAGRWGLLGSYTVESLVVPTAPQYEMSRLFANVYRRPEMVRLLQAGAVSHVVGRSLALEGLAATDDVASPLVAPVRVFSVPAPLPRTFVVSGSSGGAGDDAVRFLLDPAVDLRDRVFLSGAGAEPRRVDGGASSEGASGGAAAQGGPSGTSRIAAERPDEVVLEVEAGRPGHVVLVDGYDPGWSATVDGQEAPVLRANLAFRAVAVPAGSHVVRMRYRPPGATAGAAVSALSLALALALAATGRRAVL